MAKKKVSAETRKKISEGVRKYHAECHRNKQNTRAPRKQPPKAPRKPKKPFRRHASSRLAKKDLSKSAQVKPRRRAVLTQVAPPTRKLSSGLTAGQLSYKKTVHAMAASAGLLDLHPSLSF